MMYQVIKSLPATPGPQMKTVAPAREVVMSRHHTAAAAERAAAKCRHDHRGYCEFRVESV